MNEKEIYLCNAIHPWTEDVKKPTVHVNAAWTDNRSDYYEEYKCPHCGLVFKVELGD